MSAILDFCTQYELPKKANFCLIQIFLLLYIFPIFTFCFNIFLLAWLHYSVGYTKYAREVACHFHIKTRSFPWRPRKLADKAHLCGGTKQSGAKKKRSGNRCKPVCQPPRRCGLFTYTHFIRFNEAWMPEHRNIVFRCVIIYIPYCCNKILVHWFGVFGAIV